MWLAGLQVASFRVYPYRRTLCRFLPCTRRWTTFSSTACLLGISLLPTSSCTSFSARLPAFVTTPDLGCASDARIILSIETTLCSPSFLIVTVILCALMTWYGLFFVDTSFIDGFPNAYSAVIFF